MKPFVDTNVLLYLLSNDAHKSAAAEALLKDRVVVSVQVLNEFANVAHRKFRFSWTEVRAALVDIVRFSEVHALTTRTHELGLDIAERYGFAFYDSLIVAAALEAGCTRLASEDLQHRQRIERRLTVMNPFV